MDWVKIGWAVFMVLLLIAVFPRALQAYRNSPAGTPKQWLGALLPLLGVIVFLYLLVMLARSS